MNCLITGGCGFLGLHLVEELIKQKHKVVIFDKFRSKNLPKKINKFYKGDIKNIKSLEKSFKNIDLVFHFAALSDLNKAMNKPHDSVNYNILGTVNTLELCKNSGLKGLFLPVLFMSTANKEDFTEAVKELLKIILKNITKDII